MRIFNENKTQEIQEYDKELYYLKPDKLFIKHHEAVEEIKQVSHLEVVRKNEKTGGVEYKEVIDKPYQPPKEAYDEYEDIQVIVPYTEKELKQNRIVKIQARLDNLDKDFRQADLGAVFEDLEKRKAEFIKLHNELRVLQGKEPREYN